MDYQHYFNTKFYFYAFLFISHIIIVIFLWFNNSYLNQSDFLRKTPWAKLLIRLGVTVLLVDMFFENYMPMIKDKKVIEANSYVVETGVAKHEVYNGGLMGLSKSLKVRFEDKEKNFKIAWAEDGISAGDEVIVTYIPNTEYAVVEKAR
ncbi:MAG: hypothetical protein E7309_15985 [Butyrivibrio sp.]|nr:hypothetical protein [Butyrivibrio sp.]